MDKIYKLTTIIIVCLLFTSCGKNHPKLTHFKAFDERFTTVIDTSDSAKLKTLGDLFFDQQEANDAEGNLDFLYLIDITTKDGSSRYRCTQTGYCQLRTEGTVMQKNIVFLEQYRELYKQANLTDSE